MFFPNHELKESAEKPANSFNSKSLSLNLSKKLPVIHSKKLPQNYLEKERQFLFVFAEEFDDFVKDRIIEQCESSYEFIFEQFAFLKRLNKPIKIFVDLKPVDFSGSFKNYPLWSSSYFDGAIHLLLKNPEQDITFKIRHELIHGIFFQMLQKSSLPSWFEEGFAQLVACKENLACKEEQESFTWDKDAILSAKDWEKPFASFGAFEAKVAYKQSYELTKYLFEQSTQERQWSLFDEIAAGKNLSSDDLVKIALGEEEGFAKLLEDFRAKR